MIVSALGMHIFLVTARRLDDDESTRRTIARVSWKSLGSVLATAATMNFHCVPARCSHHDCCISVPGELDPVRQGPRGRDEDEDEALFLSKLWKKWRGAVTSVVETVAFCLGLIRWGIRCQAGG